MSQRYFYFLVVWVLGFYGEINGQKNTPKGEIVTGFSSKVSISSSIANLNGKYEFSRPHFLKRSFLLNENRSRGDREHATFLRGLDLIISTSPYNERIKSSGGRFVFRTLLKIGDMYNTTTLAPYSDQLGFFCKKEIQLDRLTPLPVRVRLGSLEYVNWLEQKPNALRY